MKYIKQFEGRTKTNFKFKINEYVKMQSEYFKIISRDHGNYVNMYKLQYIDDDTKSRWEFESDFQKLTKEEKKELNARLNAKKYNL